MLLLQNVGERRVSHQGRGAAATDGELPVELCQLLNLIRVLQERVTDVSCSLAVAAERGLQQEEGDQSSHVPTEGGTTPGPVLARACRRQRCVSTVMLC